MKLAWIDVGRHAGRNALCLGLIGGLVAACAGTPATTTSPATGATTAAPVSPTPTVSGVVSAIQSLYGNLKADAAIWIVSHPSDASLLASVESVLDPEIAALSKDTLPVTLPAVVADINNQVQALPAGMISATTKAMLNTASTLAQAVLALAKNEPNRVRIVPVSADLVVANHHFVGS